MYLAAGLSGRFFSVGDSANRPAHLSDTLKEIHAQDFLCLSCVSYGCSHLERLTGCNYPQKNARKEYGGETRGPKNVGEIGKSGWQEIRYQNYLAQSAVGSIAGAS